jgi:hypothetical protein
MTSATKKTGPTQRTMVTRETHQIHFLQKDLAKLNDESSAPATISCHAASTPVVSYVRMVNRETIDQL